MRRWLAILTGALGSVVLGGCQPPGSPPAAANLDLATTPRRVTAERTRELAARAQPDDMALIEGGAFAMGADDGFPKEAPVHTVTVSSFAIDRHEVTAAQFARFVLETDYVTEAERYGWGGVLDIEAGKWTSANGANWHEPDGPGAAADPQEPVTQVSWNDAAAYANWAGKRLPTEAEWEYAARGGAAGTRFPWGDALRPAGELRANFWQGTFPDQLINEDGFVRRAPVGSFPPNGYGLRDMIGNVWEWCADWSADDYYARSPRSDPQGPPSGEERVLRGGSWMCSENFCQGFRAAARMSSAPDSGLNNLGFRCARSP